MRRLIAAAFALGLAAPAMAQAPTGTPITIVNLAAQVAPLINSSGVNVTTGSTTNTLATWMSYLTGTSNPNPVVLGAGITNNGGAVLIQSNRPGANSANGSFNVNTVFDPSAASQAVTAYDPNQLTTSISLAGNNGVVWQNMNSVVNLTGPGTQSAEINVIHSVFTNTTTDTSFAENFEGSSNNLGTLNTFSVLLAKPGNGSTGTSTQIYGVNAGLVNNNTTAGSVGNYTAYSCSAMVGGGSVPTNNYCLANGDATQQIFTTGPVGIGIRSSASNALLVGALTNGAADATFLIKSNSGNNALMELANQDALELNFDTFSPTGALYISDRGGAATYGNHIAFHQASGITVTNGTLDAKASDVAGTITLSAAAPVLTFKVPFQGVPHALVYSTGANPGCTVSYLSLTCTGGTSGDKITYIVLQ